MVGARATTPKPLPLASLLYEDVSATQNPFIIISPLCLPGKPTVKPILFQDPPLSPALPGWGLPYGGPGTKLPQSAAGGSAPTLWSSTAPGGQPACLSPWQQPRSLCSGHQIASFITHSCLFPNFAKAGKDAASNSESEFSS